MSGDVKRMQLYEMFRQSGVYNTVLLLLDDYIASGGRLVKLSKDVDVDYRRLICLVKRSRKHEVSTVPEILKILDYLGYKIEFRLVLK